MTTRRVAVISAGMGTPSSTRLLGDRLAAAAGEALRVAGRAVRVEIIELREHARAMADGLVTGFPSGALREAVGRSRARTAWSR